MPVRDTIKDHIRESRLFNERAAWAVFISLLLIGLIASRLVFLQVVDYGHYATLSDGNRIDLVAVAPTRGFIYDRNGVVLAQNIPSFSLELIPEKAGNLDEAIARLRGLIEIGDEDVRRFYRQLRRNRPFQGIPLRFNLTDAELARFAVERHRFPGVETHARVIRHYPLGPLAAHTVGYVGRINEEELQRLDSNYAATEFIGKTGIERYYETTLHGEVGFKQVETNALGRSLRELSRAEPVPGASLHLTLDAGLQRVAEEALGGRRGAVVALDPRNGDVLALVSAPSFDPNPFVTGIDFASYDSLQRSPDKPLFNRALRGQYPPGSTVKPFIGLAGLEAGAVRIDTRSFCPGWFSLEGDDHRYRDWKRQGHGMMNLEDAIAESCDVYFYDLAVALGIDRMADFLGRFGFGQPTGIDLRNEASGLMPSREWKRARHNEPWYKGETVIVGIGQGYMLATPLQLAYATGILALGGETHPPRLVQTLEDTRSGVRDPLPPVTATPVPVRDPADWDEVVRSMVKVVHGARGTARAVGIDAAVRIAGKTGTAQVFGIGQDERYDEETVAERLRDHALFIAFAPVEEPRIAVAVLVENAGSGSTAAAPVARRVIEHYLARVDS